MGSFFGSSVNMHHNDPHFDWPEDERVTWSETEPPASVLTVEDIDGDQWTREGDRWYVSYQPSQVAFGNNGETPDDLRVYREWHEMARYAPFTEAV